MTHKLSITTNCCEQSKKFKVVRLYFPYQRGIYTYNIDRKPVWGAKGFDLEMPFYTKDQMVSVNCCPYCGVKAPEIELNTAAIDNHKIYNSDSGDYCETCGERSMCCNCLPPEFRWKPVGVDIEIPDVRDSRFDEDE